MRHCYRFSEFMMPQLAQHMSAYLLSKHLSLKFISELLKIQIFVDLLLSRSGFPKGPKQENHCWLQLFHLLFTQSLIVWVNHRCSRELNDEKKELKPDLGSRLPTLKDLKNLEVCFHLLAPQIVAEFVLSTEPDLIARSAFYF